MRAGGAQAAGNHAMFDVRARLPCNLPPSLLYESSFNMTAACMGWGRPEYKTSVVADAQENSRPGNKTMRTDPGCKSMTESNG